MHDMSFSEAEQQVLIALAELDRRGEPADAAARRRLAPDYFRRSAVDWSQALHDLVRAGFVCEERGVWTLTPAGRLPAERLHAARPPIYYFYRDYYAAAPRSRAHTLYCERVYGRDLCQHGYADVAQVEQLIAVAGLGPDSRVLDLGCGTGLISEYLAERTGARVHGVDYMSEAIQQALLRTPAKSDRLTYAVADMNRLIFPPGAFDTIVAIDALYFGDLDALLRRLCKIIEPGGQIVTYYNQMLWDESDDRTRILPDQTDLGRVLKQQGLAFQTWDFTQAELTRSRLSLAVAEAMRAEFEADDILFIYDNRIVEAQGNIRFIEAGRLARYLYRIEV